MNKLLHQVNDAFCELMMAFPQAFKLRKVADAEKAVTEELFKVTYNRSYKGMIWYLMQFAMTTLSGEDAHDQYPSKRYGSILGFVDGGYGNNINLEVGDLVMTTAARNDEWHLSWYEGYTQEDGCSPVYKLKSCETGRLADYSNIGLKVLNRYLRKSMPQWAWNDAQWANFDKLEKVYREEGSTMGRLAYPIYNGDGTVTFRLFARYGLLDGGFASVTKETFPFNEEELKLLVTDLTNQLDALFEAKKALRK